MLSSRLFMWNYNECDWTVLLYRGWDTYNRFSVLPWLQVPCPGRSWGHVSQIQGQSTPTSWLHSPRRWPICLAGCVSFWHAQHRSVSSPWHPHSIYSLPCLRMAAVPRQIRCVKHWPWLSYVSRCMPAWVWYTYTEARADLVHMHWSLY